MIIERINRAKPVANDDCVEFALEDYVLHPVVLLRLQAGITQAGLALKLGVSTVSVKRAEQKLLCSTQFLTAIRSALSKER